MRILFFLGLLLSLLTPSLAQVPSSLTELSKSAPVSRTTTAPPSVQTAVEETSQQAATVTTDTTTAVPQVQAETASPTAQKTISIDTIKVKDASPKQSSNKIAETRKHNGAKHKDEPAVKNEKTVNGENGETINIQSVLTKELAPQEDTRKVEDTLQMLSSLVQLQKNLKQQISVVGNRLKKSSSDSEKQNLTTELNNLDKQLNEASADFERLATGVDSGVFSSPKTENFSWKEEVSVLIEPTIKELKQLTARVRQKSDLKDAIARYETQLATANAAVDHLTNLAKEANGKETDSPQIKKLLNELLPVWQNMQRRITGKLDLARSELHKMETTDESFFQQSSNSLRHFFRERGWYLLLAMGTFVAVLFSLRLLARLVMKILPGAKKEQRPIHVRVFDIFFQFFSVLSAICGFVLILYVGEDWFLLSGTIIFLFGIAWTIRQTVPKMWRQVRLMLNMGAIREGERVIYQGVAWKVEAINFFCKLHNPALGMTVRIPIENITDLISRPYDSAEPWFPCGIGDWVAIEGKANAKVVSLSPEQVELVELGGRKVVYPTADFLGLAPANLSTNFFIRVVFGLSYDLQEEITTTVLEKLLAYMEAKFAEHKLADHCLSLTVDFLQAGASSLDVVIFANMRGDQAPSIGKIERSIARWCVECSNLNNWEIPFPQLTVHMPNQSK
nr:hypothetical protein [uncultured Desulfobulbus sp.]